MGPTPEMKGTTGDGMGGIPFEWLLPGNCRQLVPLWMMPLWCVPRKFFCVLSRSEDLLQPIPPNDFCFRSTLVHRCLLPLGLAFLLLLLTWFAGCAWVRRIRTSRRVSSSEVAYLVVNSEGGTFPISGCGRNYAESPTSPNAMAVAKLFI